MHGTVENRALVAGGVVFDILLSWKDFYLQTSEYSLQVEYKGEVTITTKNEHSYNLYQEIPAHIFLVKFPDNKNISVQKGMKQ